MVRRSSGQVVMVAGGTPRPRFWRSGRIVRVRTPDVTGGIRMIPRFHRGGRRVRGGTILPERHFSRFAGRRPSSRPPARAQRPVIRGQGGHDPYAAPHAHDIPDADRGRRCQRPRSADPSGCTADRGVLHIGERRPRGPIPGFPHDSKVIPKMSIFSAWAPMCRGTRSAHGRISSALSSGMFPRDCADPPVVGPDRMCSTAPTGPDAARPTAPRRALGPTAFVPLPPPAPAPMLTS